MTGLLGYDVERLGRLAEAARRAADELDGIRRQTTAGADAGARLDAGRDVAAASRFLHDRFVPIVERIVRSDPLARVGGTASEGWWADIRRAAASAARLDRALRLLDRLDGSLDVDDRGRPDPGGAALREIAAIADDLAAAVHDDPAVADRLVELGESNPWVGIAVGFADFDRGFVDRLAARMLARVSWSDDARSRHQALAAELVLDRVASDGRRSAELLTRPRVAAELADWPLLSDETRFAVVDAALGASVGDPDGVDHVQRVLAAHASLANTERFEEGFPPGLSRRLAEATVRLMPTFATRLHQRVDFTGVDGTGNGEVFGTYEEVVDYLGALLRDPVGADTLLAGLAEAARHTVRPRSDTWFRLHDVGDLGRALELAARNERLEAQMSAAGRRALIGDLSVAIGATAAVAATAAGVGAATRAATDRAARAGGDLLAARVRVDAPPIGQAGAMAKQVIRHAVLDEYLAGRAHDPDVDAADVRAARDRLTEVDALLAQRVELDDAELLARIGGALDDASVAITRLGGGDVVDGLETGPVGRLGEPDAPAD